MASLNKVQLIGNLGRDPETRYTASGDAVCSFSVACSESWKDKNTGEKKESTEWVNVTAFRKLGEICGQYLKKGSQVYVEGKLRTEKYTDKDGVEKYSTKVIADEMKMLGGRPEGSSHQTDGAQEPKSSAAKPKPSLDDLGDDIPF